MNRNERRLLDRHGLVVRGTYSIDVDEKATQQDYESAFRIACARVLGSTTEPQDWPVFFRARSK